MKIRTGVFDLEFVGKINLADTDANWCHNVLLQCTLSYIFIWVHLYWFMGLIWINC